MIIAINTGFKHSLNKSSSSTFFKETVRRIAILHPEHRFIILYEKGTKEVVLSGDNIVPVFIKQAGKHPLLWKYWYNVKLPAFLKKYKADLFVSFNCICSLRTKLPQCIMVDDISFLSHPELYKRSHLRFYKKYMPLFLNKAIACFALTEFTKQQIGKKYKTPLVKLNVTTIGVNESYQPADMQTKEAIRNKYTEGKEYFICKADSDSENDVITLLKAFSLFKKKQKTNMKLVLVGEIAIDKKLIKSLSSYKYRSDVVLADIADAEELVKITAAAYASVFPCLGDEYNLAIAEAMLCDVPVIAINEDQKKERAKEAALYAEVNDNIDMADKMMLLYKDEKLRKELIENGRKITAQFSWDKTAADVWDSILKALD